MDSILRMLGIKRKQEKLCPICSGRTEEWMFDDFLYPKPCHVCQKCSFRIYEDSRYQDSWEARMDFVYGFRPKDSPDRWIALKEVQ